MNQTLFTKLSRVLAARDTETAPSTSGCPLILLNGVFHISNAATSATKPMTFLYKKQIIHWGTSLFITI